MDHDADLLHRFIDSRDDAAFGSLVGRYSAFVHAVALRQTRGDHALADDVAQATFIVLARRAKHAARSASLRGWLHATTCYAAANALRADRRRARRERAAIATAAALDPREIAASRDELAILDAALASLRAGDRDAIVLHHVEGRPLAAVGHAIGTTPEAAKKRIQRAMARLRATLGARELALPTAFAAWLASGPRDASAAVLPGGANGRAFTIARRVTTMMKVQSIKSFAVAIAAALLMTGGIAIVAAQRPNAPPGAQSQAAAPVVATLPGDVRVELIGICSLAEPSTWWRADGTPLPTPPITAVPAPVSPLANYPDRLLAFRVSSSASAHVVLDLLDPKGTTLTIGDRESRDVGTQPTGGERVELVRITGRADQPTADVTASVDGSAWSVVEAIDVTGTVVGPQWAVQIPPAERLLDDGLYVDWSTPLDVDGSAFVQVFDDFPNRDRAIVAIDRSGVEHATSIAESPTFIGGDAVGHVRLTGRFAGLPLANISRFEFRLRERPTVLFSDVALRPGEASDPRVSEVDSRRERRSADEAPADQMIRTPLAFDGMRIDEALAAVGRASHVRVEVSWPQMIYSGVHADSIVKGVALGQAFPATAVRAVWEAAGGYDATVLISDDGRTIRLVPGRWAVQRGDGRSFRLAQRN